MGFREGELWADRLERAHGGRPPFFDEIELPQGYVINGRLPRVLLGRFNDEHAYPLMFSSKEDAAMDLDQRWIQKIQQYLADNFPGEKNEIVPVLAQTAEGVWNLYPVLINDVIQKSRDRLSDEIFEARKQGQTVLVELKRQARLALRPH